jgi:protein subunit release factor A
MDIKDCRIDIWDGGRIRTGMQPVMTDNGVKVTHLPTGLIAYANGNPSQHKNRNVALAMLDAGVTEMTKQAKGVPTPKKE